MAFEILPIALALSMATVLAYLAKLIHTKVLEFRRSRQLKPSSDQQPSSNSPNVTCKDREPNKDREWGSKYTDFHR